MQRQTVYPQESTHYQWVSSIFAFRPLDRERFVCGSAKSLGTEYTKERIMERIKEKALVKDKKRIPFPTRRKPIVKDYSKKNLIDTTEDKFAGSPGLKHWADIQNTPILFFVRFRTFIYSFIIILFNLYFKIVDRFTFQSIVFTLQLLHTSLSDLIVIPFF